MPDNNQQSGDGSLTIGPTLDTLDEGVIGEIAPGAAPDSEGDNDDQATAQKDQEPAVDDPDRTSDADPDPDNDEGQVDAEGNEDGPVPFDVDRFATEWMQNGSLTEETRADLDKELASRGLPSEMADIYFEGLAAIQEQRTSALEEAAGGKDAFEALVKWGGENLDAPQIEAFNSTISTAILEGDSAAATMMIAAVKAQMGGEPSYLNSKPSTENPTGVQPFQSQAEVTRAMRDPRYTTDKAYVQSVTDRLRVSNF